jgi:hypothetical protein
MRMLTQFELNQKFLSFSREKEALLSLFSVSERKPHFSFTTVAEKISKIELKFSRVNLIGAVIIF